MIYYDAPLQLEDCSLYVAINSITVMPEGIEENFYRLISVNSGACHLECCNTVYELEAGQFFAAFPFETIDIVNKTSDFEFAFICFSVNSTRYGEVLGSIKAGLSDKQKRVFDNRNISLSVRNICRELENEDRAFSRDLVSLLCSQMLVYILRNFDDVLSDSISGNEANMRVCGQVMGYIDSHIYNMKNLCEVASALGYNYSYISTLFRKTSGMTLNAYFKSKRMNEAKRLLQDNKMSVSEIARVMNYSSVYAFSKAFKEYFGSSPGYYSGRFPKKEC